MGFGGQPFWAAHARDLPDRIEIDSALFSSPAGRMMVPCERCPGPAITPEQMPTAACPACNGGGIAPSWVGQVLLGGRFCVELESCWEWGPSVCGVCVGWGCLAPTLAAPTESVAPKAEPSNR